MKKRVLLIEDDELQAQLVKALFSMKFPTVELVRTDNANDGIAKLKSSHFDLLILDLILPDRDGTSIIDEIAAIPTPPIIVVSAMNDSNTVIKTRVLDIVAFVVKPIDKDFISLVRSILINVN
jgi:DNA-binding response OmpR family regulator